MEDLKRIAEIFSGIFISLWELISWLVSTAWHSGVSPSVFDMIGIFAIIALWLGSGFAAATVAELRERSRFLHMILGLALPLAYPAAIFLLMPRCKYDIDPADAAAAKEAEVEARLKKEKEAKASEQEPEPEVQTPQTRQTDPLMPIPPQEEEEDARDSGSDTLKMSRASIVQSVPRTPISVTEFDTASTRTPAHGISIPKPAQRPQAASSSFKAFDQRHFASIATDAEGNSRGPFMIETSDGRFLEAIRIINALPDLIVLEMAGEGGKLRSVRLPYSKIKDCKLKSDWLGQ